MKYALIALCAIALSLTACQKKEVTMMVHEAKSFETAEGMTVGAALLMLHNMSDKDDQLVKVETALTPRAEIHNMIDENGIMKMRKVDFVPLTASGMTALTPDGYHIMLMDLKEPLKEGQTYDMIFYFKNSAPVTATIPVLSRKALSETMDKMDHHGHH